MSGNLKTGSKAVGGLRQLLSPYFEDALDLNHLSQERRVTGLGKLTGSLEFLICQLWLSQMNVGQAAEHLSLNGQVTRDRISGAGVCQQKERIPAAALQAKNLCIEEPEFRGPLRVMPRIPLQLLFGPVLGNSQVAVNYFCADVPNNGFWIRGRRP